MSGQLSESTLNTLRAMGVNPSMWKNKSTSIVEGVQTFGLATGAPFLLNAAGTQNAGMLTPFAIAQSPITEYFAFIKRIRAVVAVDALDGTTGVVARRLLEAISGSGWNLPAVGSWQERNIALGEGAIIDTTVEALAGSAGTIAPGDPSFDLGWSRPSGGILLDSQSPFAFVTPTFVATGTALAVVLQAEGVFVSKSLLSTAPEVGQLAGCVKKC